VHNSEFTAANSLYGKLLTLQHFEKIFKHYVDRNTTLHQLSTELHRDPAQLSRYVDELASNLERRIPHQETVTSIPPPPNNTTTPVSADRAHLDVTFCKNTKNHTKICIPTRNDGNTAPPRILTRLNAEAFTECLHQLHETFGLFPIYQSDGETALASAFDQLQLPAILLQHIHQPPYDRVTALMWIPPLNCGCHLRLTLGIPASFPKQPGTYHAKLAFKLQPCSAHQCICKPKYCKENDHHPLCEPCKNNTDAIMLLHRVSGLWLHKVWNSPVTFTFEAHGEQRPPTIPSEQWRTLPEPWASICAYWVPGILVGIWRSYRGHTITNNRSESVNWQFKAFMRWQGRPSDDDRHIIRKVLVWWAKKFRPHYWKTVLHRWVFKKRWRLSTLLQAVCPWGTLVEMRCTLQPSYE
jgi:hypothetical protein